MTARRLSWCSLWLWRETRVPYFTRARPWQSPWSSLGAFTKGTKLAKCCPGYHDLRIVVKELSTETFEETFHLVLVTDECSMQEWLSMLMNHVEVVVGHTRCKAVSRSLDCLLCLQSTSTIVSKLNWKQVRSFVVEAPLLLSSVSPRRSRGSLSYFGGHWYGSKSTPQTKVGATQGICLTFILRQW